MTSANTNIEQLYDYYLQQVAAESYLEGGVEAYSGSRLREQLRLGTNRKQLRNPINQGYRGYTRLTEAQIDEFQDKFVVIHQWSDNPIGTRPTADGITNPPDLANTGLSATLIFDKARGSYTLAVRSTEFRPWSDGGDAERDKTGADVREIGFNGFALAQLDALERYYAWLKSSGKLPQGKELNVTGYSLGGHLATIFTEIHQSDSDIRFGETVTFNGAGRGTWDGARGSLQEMILFFRRTLADPDFAKNDPQVSYNSTLWGAAKGRQGTAMDALSLYQDPRYDWAKYATFNKFGAGNVVQFFKNALAGEADGGVTNTTTMGRITQVFGHETIANTNFTANSGTHGPTVRVGIESQPLTEGTSWNPANLLAEDFGNGHSITLLGDSLAVQRALHALDSTFTLDQFISILPATTNRKITNYVGANYEVDALENVLDGLRRMIQGQSSQKTPAVEGAGGFGDWDARNTFQNNLKALTESVAFKALAGKARIGLAIAGDLATQARTDFSAFLSLYALSPLVLRSAGVDTTVQAILKQANEALAQQWEADQGLMAEQRDIGLENFTDTYLLDRQALLQYKVAANIKDATANPDGYLAVQGGRASETNLRFIDITSGTLLQVNTTRPSPSTAPNQYVMFGDDAANTINGGERDDRAYGGGGGDMINGLAGDDYLEGNDGTDTLDGGAGVDTLLGGTGDDTVVGGEGNDFLLGGQGNDKYYFEGNSGLDIIRDADGQGKIVVGAPGFEALSGGKKLADSAYISADGQVTYTLIEGNLVIRPISSGVSRGIITVKGWKPGDLGITLSETLVPPTATTTTYTGDFVKRKNVGANLYVLGPDGNYIADEPQAGTPISSRVPPARTPSRAKAAMMRCAAVMAMIRSMAALATTS